MTDEKLIEALRTCQDTMRRHVEETPWYAALGISWATLAPVRNPFAETRLGKLQHILHVTVDAETLVRDLRFEKANRLLGWVQGALWGMVGAMEIEERT